MNSGRLSRNINDDWKFNKLDSVVKDEILNDFDDSSWGNINLPHTWNSEDGCDGWVKTYNDGSPYYRGKGVYRKVISITDDELKKQVFIEFEGANTITELYINSVYAGKHEGGYAKFRFDITELINKGNNQIVVIVDNSETDYIAPIKSEGDFTKMGGIYRDVSIVMTDKVHIDMMDFGSSGVFLTPKNIADTSSELDIAVKLKNDSDSSAKTIVSAVLNDVKGNSVGSADVEVMLDSGNNGVVKLNIQCQNIHLWNGIANPYLYSCEITVKSGDYIDVITENIGFRTYSFDTGRGILLNGERLYLKGVNYHQDSYENGWAMTSEQRDRDYNKMLEMGVNSVRMAHYQHHSHEYDICDSKGLIVWTELPLINRTTVDNEKFPSEKFEENINQQLIEMIRQNYNHPSIIFWGISNELYDVDEKTLEIYQKLIKKAKKEDTTRTTIYADNIASKETKARGEKADAVGYNRYDGWYYSKLGEMSNWINEKYAIDSRPTCVSEYGGAGAISQHMDEPNISDISANGKEHYEEYLSILHEETWADLSKMNNIFGSFIWCMYDFASDTREEGDTMGQNDKGLITRKRIEKDAFFFINQYGKISPWCILHQNVIQKDLLKFPL